MHFIYGKSIKHEKSKQMLNCTFLSNLLCLVRLYFDEDPKFFNLICRLVGIFLVERGWFFYFILFFWSFCPFPPLLLVCVFVCSPFFGMDFGFCCIPRVVGVVLFFFFRHYR